MLVATSSRNQGKGNTKREKIIDKLVNTPHADSSSNDISNSKTIQAYVHKNTTETTIPFSCNVTIQCKETGQENVLHLLPYLIKIDIKPTRLLITT